MKKKSRLPIIELEKLDTEVISPEEFLSLSEEEKQDILKAIPIVKQLGSIDISDSDFVSILIKYKNPRYIFNFE